MIAEKLGTCGGARAYFLDRVILANKGFKTEIGIFV
jgi:hypothetical protein